MAKEPRRIDLSLLDDHLRTLINASAKIFPVPYSYVEANVNPEDYEYVRVTDSGVHKREIYHWDGVKFGLIGADDKDVDFVKDVTNKPETYPPSQHSHVELHTHDNKTLLDGIDSEMIADWDGAAEHVQNGDVHITEDEKEAISGMEDHIENETIHLSENDIEAIGEIDGIEQRVSDIETGHSAAHAHDNLAVLDGITSDDVEKWDGVTSKVDSTEFDTALSGKVDSTTFSGHTNSTTVHVTSEEKSTWNGKADTDTTYDTFKTDKDGLVPKSVTSNETDYLRRDGNWATPPDTVYVHPGSGTNPHGTTKSDVGLGNVTNESKETMFTSPALTGTPTAPTADSTSNDTQIATTAFVKSAMSGAGQGDMLKSAYAANDKSASGYVDKAIDSDTVNGKTVKTDVPENAVFTDTKYTHPSDDGDLHVPATGTGNNGKVLKAGNTAKSISWGTLSNADVGAAAASHIHAVADITDFPSLGIQVARGSTKPAADTVYWYKVIT